MKYILPLGVAMLLIFSACKKKEETTDPCSNGFLDPGEVQPDCGGNCPPCAENYTTSLYLKVNGITTSMNSKSLNYNGTNWILSMSNDSLAFSFDLGSDGSVGSYAISPSNTSCTSFGTLYPNQSNGTCAISYHDTVANRMSGFFQIDFSRNGFVDTVHVTNGQFDYFTY